MDLGLASSEAEAGLGVDEGVGVMVAAVVDSPVAAAARPIMSNPTIAASSAAAATITRDDLSVTFPAEDFFPVPTDFTEANTARLLPECIYGGNLTSAAI